ncbi:acyltransferase [Zoogloeaceae bacterium G21618-S1]|nr:acyltransferase [Zoogloeaceae bacterium G21618-S1]
MGIRGRLRLWFYQSRRFGGRYRQGAHSSAILSKILIGKDAAGQIVLGDYVICAGELYSFFSKGVISVGDCSYVGQGTRIWALSRVEIGRRVLISHDCFICDNLTHPLNAQTRHQQYMAKHGFPFPEQIELEERPILIGDDVWVAAGVTILRGVSIGQGAVIAAGSVITTDVPAGVVVAGNPARVVKQLGTEQTIERGVVNGIA